jgi:hypothetical protein
MKFSLGVAVAGIATVTGFQLSRTAEYKNGKSFANLAQICDEIIGDVVESIC